MAKGFHVQVRFILCGTVALWPFWLTTPLLAEEEPLPHLCTGYDPDTGTWGDKGPWSKPPLCARGHAVLLVVPSRTVPSRTTAERTPDAPLSFSCCPLPDGVLKDEQYFTTGHCPDSTVATGQVALAEGKYNLRCTAIDTSRIVLGPPAETVLIEPVRDTIYGLKHAFLSLFSPAIIRRRVFWSQIPPAARYGLGRLNREHWLLDGVMGDPLGAVLTESADGEKDYVFRPLLWRGDEKHPPGSPVKMFPDCQALDDPLTPAPRCLP